MDMLDTTAGRGARPSRTIGTTVREFIIGTNRLVHRSASIPATAAITAGCKRRARHDGRNGSGGSAHGGLGGQQLMAMAVLDGRAGEFRGGEFKEGKVVGGWFDGGGWIVMMGVEKR